MPRELVRSRHHNRLKSLGWLAVAWMEYFIVHGPGDVMGEPVKHGDEYTGFIADSYAVDAHGRLLYDSAFFSRPKGADKSGLGARYGLFEGLGPCRFAGWAKGGEEYRDPWGMGFTHTYQPGEPMGRPVQSPYIRCLATEETQTGNVYDTILYNLSEGPLAETMSRRDDAGKSRIVLPGSGEITPSTASSAAKDGGKETWACFDESHLYNTPELRRMYEVVTRNMRKRKLIAGTWYLETTTMFAPAEDSIAERTYQLSQMMRERQLDTTSHKKILRERLLFDHRWGECDDLSDEKSLRAAVTEAYGDAMEWNDLDGIVDEFNNPRAQVDDSRRYFLNAPTSASNAYLAQHEWAGRGPATAILAGAPIKDLAPRDIITLGFDGSRGRAKGKPDATALIGCRVEDGHVFEVGVWEASSVASSWDTWEPNIVEIEAAIADAFKRYTVAAFYADPGKDWRSHVNAWEAKYGAKTLVKPKKDHPFEWWMTGGRSGLVQIAVESFEGAVRNGDMTHDGSYALTRHVLNARRRLSHGKLALAKENDYSVNKIDAAVAAVLAWQARLDAITAGVTKPRKRGTKLQRLY